MGRRRTHPGGTAVEMALLVTWLLLTLLCFQTHIRHSERQVWKPAQDERSDSRNWEEATVQRSAGHTRDTLTMDSSERARSKL